MAKKKSRKAQEQRVNLGLALLPKASENAHPSLCPSIATGSSIHNRGTSLVELRPYIEITSFGGLGGHGTQDRYETISAQPEYSNFSLEELRLADYERGVEVVLNASAASSVTTSAASSATSAMLGKILPRSNSKRHSSHLNLLRGPGIEVHVGIKPSENELAGNDARQIWSLPKGLISHYSAFLAAACSQDFKEGGENRIELQDDDATVFALFVEWMYYGEYGIAQLSLPPADSVESPNTDAKCWVLGEKLLCTDFKNYAMSRLYTEHTAAIFSRVVTICDVRFAFSNSGVDSKLRQLYLALVATHFSNPSRIQGTAKEWDSLILEHADMRLFLL